MRGVLAATALVGALAIGGLPALALTTAYDDRPSAPAAADTHADDHEPGSGPPPWARAHGHEKHADKHLDRHSEKHSEKRARNSDKRAAGPDQARPEDDRDETDRARGPKAVQPGRAEHPGNRRGHPQGPLVRAWAHCLATQARALAEGELLDPVEACGPPPTPRGS